VVSLSVQGRSQDFTLAATESERRTGLENIVIFSKVLKISKISDFFSIFSIISIFLIYIEHLHIHGSDCICCCAVTVTIRELVVGPF